MLYPNTPADTTNNDPMMAVFEALVALNYFRLQ